MGNDSGVKSKHKRRTPPHNKHSVFPGMRIPAGVNIVSGSIKNVPKEAKPKIIKALSG